MKKATALIVDDDPSDRFILSQHLRSAFENINIIELDNGADAIDYFSNPDKHHNAGEFPPELIFLDINMPVVNGFNFLSAFEKIREEHNYDSCAVVMYTSSASKQDIDKAQSYDFVQGFITKGEHALSSLKSDLLSTI
ncbi:response regulator [Pleionea sp. CnH1-48]|uniref:response regulator n=1 Tax=Pleionea sp. CnH1-48 TaxID=2954494 RepID=UPI0020982A9B|nr:response regulator [Pleionea sp. CnH1-48]MCO7224878.1 response regulator [Pleionea sp. CnH1-48]